MLSHEVLGGVSIRQLLTAAKLLQSGNGVTLDLGTLREEAVACFLEKRNNLGVQSKSEDVRLIVTVIGEHVVTLVREKGNEYWVCEREHCVSITTKSPTFYQIMGGPGFSLDVPNGAQFQLIVEEAVQRSLDRYMWNFHME